MSIHALHHADKAPIPKRPGGPRDLGSALLAEGALSSEQLFWAASRQRLYNVPLADVLRGHGLVSETALTDAIAAQAGTTATRLAAATPSVEDIDRIGAGRCLRDGILPLGRAGGRSRVATAQPDRFAALRPMLEDKLGPVAMAVMSPSEIAVGVLRFRRRQLVHAAETRSPASQSTRTLIGDARWAAALVVLGAISVAALAAPVATFSVAAALAMAVLAINTALLVLASLFHLRPVPELPEAAQPALIRFPKVSLLVPLFREKEIAGELLERLSAIDYPAELLDIKLIVEASDTVTFAALDRAALPPTMRVIAVPEGEIQTKPRAMNFALDQCAGDIIGIYDAEDEPAPDQIQRTVSQFARSDPRVACLQGRLNFYNARQSWLSRCFAIEYATWFGMVLPALHRLGWAVPLGGTTVFFRRTALEQVGAWDAHNVTEDADLGMRLARNGYRTDLLHSITMEEATCTPLKWIRQRSRWLKGYAITWAVHMRSPAALWRDLGPWRFIGFQVLFLGSLASTVLAPVLWSFWLLAFNLPHPLRGLIPDVMGFAVMAGLFSAAVLGGIANALALKQLRIEWLRPWIPLVHLYFPLATAAMVKALAELLLCPFFWDKTDHGVSAPDQVREPWIARRRA